MPLNKITKSLGTIILAFLAGVVYRMGGSGNYPRWIREVGVAIILILEFTVLGIFNYGCLLFLGTGWIESTYFKIKGNTMTLSWILVGIAFSVVISPWFIYSWITNLHPLYWKGYLLRTIICMGFVVIWNQILSAKVAKALNLGKDITDEFGRGAIQLLTVPLILIG